MKHIPLIVLVITISVLGYNIWTATHRDTCVVNRIIDGDTIICDHERIRLYSVMAEELDTGRGEIHKQMLRNVLPIGTTIILIPGDDGRTHDKYGRTLADIYIENRHQNQKLQQTLKEVTNQFYD